MNGEYESRNLPERNEEEKKFSSVPEKAERTDNHEEEFKTEKEESEELSSALAEAAQKFLDLEKEKQIPSEERQKRIQEWQEKYIPAYLKDKPGKPGIITEVFSAFAKMRGFEASREDEENIPEKGPFLAICNHFYGEAPILLNLFKEYDVHIVAGQKTNWQYWFKNWFLKKLRMVSVEESLSNLPEAEKEEALREAPLMSRSGYGEIIEREKGGHTPINIKFVRESVALLLRGDVMAIYPEGPIASEKKGLRQGYKGAEFLADQYKRITGEDLPVLPVAVFGEEKNKVRIGKPLLISENHTGLSNTDWLMTNLAQLLPEEKRGYYSALAKNEK